MSGLENALFQLTFTAKQLRKQSSKAKRESESEKKKVKKAIQEGNNDIAKLYAQNAIRKNTEQLDLLKLSSRLDATASRIKTAVTMRRVTGNMSQVVRGMDRALMSMNPEQISLVMDKFESQFEDLEATSSYYENASANASAVNAPQEEIDLLMQQVADEAGLELQQNLDAKEIPQAQAVDSREKVEDTLNERLRALRN